MPEQDSFTAGLIPGRIPQGDSGFYDLGYFKGNRTDQKTQVPTDGSFLDPESEYQNKFKDILSWIKLHIDSGRVLDAGAGPGHLKYWANKLNLPFTIINCDISTELLRSKYNLNKEASVISVIDQLPFGNGKFKAVLLSDVLEHVWPNQALRAVQEAHRVLEIEGNIFVNIPNRETWNDAALRDEGHVWLPTIDEVISMLRLGGFNIGEIDMYTRGFPDSNIFREKQGYDLKLPTGGRSIFTTAKKY